MSTKNLHTVKTITDKYQFKNVIKNHITQLSIDPDFFDRFFSPVFTDIFEKETQAACVLDKLHLKLTQHILAEVQKIDKKNKADFLLLFEDYQKINTELDEIIIRINGDCKNLRICESQTDCLLNFSHYPILCERTNNIELKTFRPELTLHPLFIELIENSFGQFGIYFLYNSEHELIFIGAAENLGSQMLEKIWEKNIDGYASIAYTNTLADIYVYEPYCRLKEMPLLNGFKTDESLSFNLPPLEKSIKVQIFEK